MLSALRKGLYTMIYHTQYPYLKGNLTMSFFLFWTHVMVHIISGKAVLKGRWIFREK